MEYSDQPRPNEATIPPLVVDLDGCLIRTDLLWESCLLLVKKSPLTSLLLPFWLLRGKAYLKRRVAERVGVDAQLLPYNTAFLEYLRQENEAGRSLALATASDEKFAVAVAKHLGVFNTTLASNGTINLAGKRKLSAIVELYGERGFDYAGNSAVDMEIWPHAREAILVSPRRGIERMARNSATVTKVFPPSVPSLKDYLRALRVHQWLKNLLLFVPLFTAHAWHDTAAASHVLMAFLAFCLCASSTYIINDLLDLPSDRGHPNKRHRPFAAGTVPLTQGVAISALAMLAGLGLGGMINLSFLGVLTLYVGITLAYSLHLKTYVLIDVIVLAGLYTLRVVAGGLAATIPISFWLLAFSMFLFMSLAIVKRHSELTILAQANKIAAGGRDYRVTDLANIASMGTASGYLSVLVLALYLQSQEVVKHYTHGEVLWLLCPTFLYWVSRIWLKAGRGEMHDDPVVFAVYDRGSRYVFAAIIVIVLLAI